MAVDKPSFFLSGPLMYYFVVSIGGRIILEDLETYISDRVCKVPRNQRLRAVYIPTGDEALEIVPHSLNDRLSV